VALKFSVGAVLLTGLILWLGEGGREKAGASTGGAKPLLVEG
jgi:hypothetical protein